MSKVMELEDCCGQLWEWSRTGEYCDDSSLVGPTLSQLYRGREPIHPIIESEEERFRRLMYNTAELMLKPR